MGLLGPSMAQAFLAASLGLRERVLYPSRRNGLKRPVLKHGPRSLTTMRVFGWQTRMRKEIECVRHGTGQGEWVIPRASLAPWAGL
jgi:hypothetical protein